MVCRFCGARIPEDSRFCSRCGKGVSAGEGPVASGLVGRLRLKTPYPWAGALFVVFLAWTAWPGESGVDLSTLSLELELEGESGSPEENLFRHYLSLVVENRGTSPVAEIPVELVAAIEPGQPVDLVSEFRGERFVVLRDGEARPLTLILSDEIPASGKRRFPIDSVVTTQAPAEVTYTIRKVSGGEALAELRAGIGAGAGDPLSVP
jgi:hypothetical protein